MLRANRFTTVNIQFHISTQGQRMHSTLLTPPLNNLNPFFGRYVLSFSYTHTIHTPTHSHSISLTQRAKKEGKKEKRKKNKKKKESLDRDEEERSH